MKGEDCRMKFSEALEQFLDAREDIKDSPRGCRRWLDNLEKIKEAQDHMDALTGFSKEREKP